MIIGLAPRSVIRLIGGVGLVNLALFLFASQLSGRDRLYLPKTHSSALRSTIDEKGFAFYFALKDYYAGKTIVVPDASTIDLAVTDRLTFMRPQIRHYDARLNAEEEAMLLRLLIVALVKPYSIAKYVAHVRHHASVPTGRDELVVLINATQRSREVILMRGARDLYFVPEEHLVRSGGDELQPRQR